MNSNLDHVEHEDEVQEQHPTRRYVARVRADDRRNDERDSDRSRNEREDARN